MATATLTPRQPIINGSVNPRLTADDLAAATYEAKVQALWSLQVHCDFPRAEADMDPALVAKLERTYTYEEIQAIPADKLAENILTELKRHERHYQYIKNETYAHHVGTGRKIRKAQRSLGFGGELSLTLGKLIGYLMEEGGWNEFDPFEVGRVLKSLDASAPRKDCGDNNPNTGRTMHEWTVNGAYIFLKVGYCSASDLERWQQWYTHTASPLQKQMKADSMRLVVEPCEGFHKGGADLTLVLWWD